MITITIDTGTILAILKFVNWVIHVAIGLAIIHGMEFLEKKSQKIAILFVAIWIIIEGTYIWWGL